MNFEQIRLNYPIVEIMERLGCDTSHHGYMYHAPYRQDRTPSMHIDARRNVWCDYGCMNPDGTPVGGGNIELVKRITGIESNTEAAQKILDIFNHIENSIAPVFSKTENRHKESGRIIITSTLNMVLSKSLQFYLQQRCIDPNLASRWCYEVNFRNGQDGKELYAIGFPNDRGSFALRNSFYKGCNGQGVSTIIKGRSIVGPLDREDRHFYPNAGKGKVLVFEGFMDYLSYLTLYRTLDPPHDVIVLNSTANVSEAIPFLQSHDSIECWTDNDESGKRVQTIIQDRCPDSDVRFMGACYSKYNDLNDYLVCETEKLCQGQQQSRGQRIQ